LYEYIEETQPDHILCTHFLPADVIEEGRKRYGIDTPVSVVVTDYDVHGLWTSSHASHYFVATEKIQWKLIQRGIKPEQVTVSGIPIDPDIFSSKNENSLRQELHIPPEDRILLLLAGGQGSSKSDTVLKILCESKQPATIIAIAGKNKRLEKKLRATTVPSHIKLIVLGWTDHIHDYLRIADVIITKPGGATTTECIQLQKPIIAINPIPGQEEQNTTYILHKGFGVAAQSAEDLLYYISLSPEQLAPGYKRSNKKSAGSAAEVVLDTLVS
ncbi:MAG: glycosyltransferase, partial [Patescibacteria group bacterium]